MQLRKRLAGSEWLIKFGAGLLHLYIRFCHATTRWEREGFEEMEESLRSGQPLISVIWHERLLMSPYLFNTKLGRICAITTESRVATLGKSLLEHFDFESEQIDPKKDPTRFNRQIIRRIRDGYSIGISPDGTRGPPRIAKSFPVKWARSTRVPIFCVSFAMRRTLRVPNWARPHFPLPFNRGVLLVRRWDEDVPRKASAEEIEALTGKLTDALNALTLESDQRVGRAP